ncbi:MAG: acetyltransferase [Sterolibacterium sp.]|nr:acetyltransferase [Sterolibacterium sp.]
MADIDVFNGDADGIYALTQLRLAEPRAARQVTGIKRDIDLLSQVEAQAGDRVTVLDVSFDSNRAGVERLLERGAEIFYVDHHYAGEIAPHAGLTTLINEAPEVCTSLLVSGWLEHRYRAWAVVGAFGDNLAHSAQALARPLELDAARLAQLERLGICLNYNSYGESLADLHFAPDELFRLVSRHASPFEFMQESREHFERLATGYDEDMARASAWRAEAGSTAAAALFMLPDAAWARRVSGVFSNDLSNQHPGRAHAVLTAKANGSYLVSVRAPLNRRKGADALCRQFPSGGGRAAAAGINALPAEALARFTQAFLSHVWG